MASALPLRKGRTLVLLPLLTLPACGSEGGDLAVVAPEMAPPPSFARDAADVAIGGGGIGVDLQVVAEGTSAESGVRRQVAHQGHARIRVTSVEEALPRTQRMILDHRGEVVQVNRQGGEWGPPTAGVTARIPVDRWDAFLGGLEELGRIDELRLTAEDVSEQVIDLDARLSTTRELENRLVELLRDRAGSLTDVLAAERELARVRSEIERMVAQDRRLTQRTATGTLTIELREADPLAEGRAGRNPLLFAFRRAWENFVGMVTGLIAAAGWFIPLGLALYLLLRLFLRFSPFGKGRKLPRFGRRSTS